VHTSILPRGDGIVFAWKGAQDSALRLWLKGLCAVETGVLQRPSSRVLVGLVSH